MNRTKILSVIGIGLIIAAAVYSTTRVDFGEGEVTANLIIDIEDRITCKESIPAGSNVFDLMTACNIPFEEDGGFVISINGVSQDPASNTYWMYYINETSATVGAAEYIVQEGDQITWRLESF